MAITRIGSSAHRTASLYRARQVAPATVQRTATRAQTTAVRTSAATATAAPTDVYSPRPNGPLTDPATGGRADFNQGNTNACGTTSLAIALHNLGIEVPRSEIDKAIRNFNTFTSMDEMVDWARGRGLQADMYNKGSFETLRSQLSQGRQVIALTDPDGGSNANMHYVVVSGAYTQNGQRFLQIQDPSGGKQYAVKYEDFEKKWSNLKAGGIGTGYDRAYLLVDKRGKPGLPPGNSFDMALTNAVTHGYNNVVNGVADIKNGRVIEGAFRVVGGATALGIVKTFGLPFAVASLASGVGQKWLDKSKEMLKSSNWLTKAGGLFVGAGGGIMKGIGWLGEQGKNLVGTVANAVGSGIEKVGNAIGNGVKKVGNFIKSLF